MLNFIQKVDMISEMIVQLDTGSAQQVNSPDYLICAQQTRDKIDTPDKKKNCFFW